MSTSKVQRASCFLVFGPYSYHVSGNSNFVKRISALKTKFIMSEQSLSVQSLASKGVQFINISVSLKRLDSYLAFQTYTGSCSVVLFVLSAQLKFRPTSSKPDHKFHHFSLSVLSLVYFSFYFSSVWLFCFSSISS